MKSHITIPLALSICMMLVFGVFQNCGAGFEATSEGSSLLVLEAFDKNCLSNQGFDACIYYKSPIVHFKQINVNLFTDEIYATDNLLKYQTYGVKLEGLVDPKKLSSDDFTVYDSTGQIVTTTTSWRLPYSVATEAFTGQVSSYFFAEKLNRFFFAHGKDYLLGKNISLVTDARGNGWSFARNTVYLQNSTNRSSMDGSTVVHLLTEAAIAHSTTGEVYNLSADTKHADCGSPNGPVYVKDCCTTMNGCSKAVTAGLADYAVALLFPEHPTMGEHLNRDLAGISICAAKRDVRKSSLLTATQAFNVCAPTYRPGQVFVMGNFYASVLWSIRSHIQSERPALVNDFDSLYVDLVGQVSAADDFTSILVKMKQIDLARFNSNLTGFIETEYLARGLALN